ncbi:hypothetical protein TSAR_001029 [Trichomalopsis sarcophagae]|uniref:Uncharacterized protein n=1 Tax=Trichomalopsis sarcophagae TaxID=543379 RepID=A0A232FMB3_9HYME|nr:hypothetical protein TSAR_001029 [Trichomalopsis sarcophagae]
MKLYKEKTDHLEFHFATKASIEWRKVFSKVLSSSAIYFKHTKMKLQQQAITAGAYGFAFILSVLLLKYALYEKKFAIAANLLLVVSVACFRLFLLKDQSTRLQEGIVLILFILFDRNLLNFGNLLLLLGVACVREQFHRESPADKDVLYKETVSLTCGLIFALMDWYSVGRILIINALIVFYYHTILKTFSVFLVFINWFFNFYEFMMGNQKQEPYQTKAN